MEQSATILGRFPRRTLEDLSDDTSDVRIHATFWEGGDAHIDPDSWKRALLYDLTRSRLRQGQRYLLQQKWCDKDLTDRLNLLHRSQRWHQK
mmetsp:Transcript_35416/g.85447  ORF Transcript_35416/g.85447 Transcript_35416/m.85447 type:complete len:92 (-) Transcript_35416:682-957(-)